MRTKRSTMRSVMIAGVLLSIGTLNAQPWVQTEEASKLLRENKHTEAAALFKALTDANQYDGYAWSQLGYCLHANKQYEEALKAYARAIELGQGRPANLYNSACAYALLGRKDEALDWLRKALEARFAEQETLEKDTDLDSLRSDIRFAELTGITRGLKDQPAANRDEGWRWDLEFYLRRMKQMHWDLYARVPEATLKREIDKLKDDVGSLSDGQIRARLKRITALAGDGHTASRLYPEGEQIQTLPMQMFHFKEGLYVIGAAPSCADLIGTKIIKVGTMETSAAMTAARAYASADNEMNRLAQVTALLALPTVLHDMGAAADASGVPIVAEKPDGSRVTMRVEPVTSPQGGGRLLTEGYAYLHESLPGERPLYLRDTDKPIRMEHLPDQKAVYFYFGAVRNPQGQSFSDFVTEMFRFINTNDVEHLVIDMRFNGGGNTGLVPPLMEELIKCEKINQRGHLWVIVGRHTFSAAQNTVNLMDAMTKAVFVGEPTGSCPQFVGESTSFVLPHSRTRVYCSSRYWQFLDSTDERTFVSPDVLAEPTFATYKANRDPAMEAILEWMKRHELTTTR